LLKTPWQFAVAVGAALLCSTTAPVAPASAEATGASFFDSFDRLDTSRWYISDGWVNGPIQSCTWSKNNVGVQNGMLQLRLTHSPNALRQYSCAEIRTRATLGYGTYEARLRPAVGSGLNSAMFTYSGPPLTPVHDELDFEFLGKAPQKVQLNYYVSGTGGHESLAVVPANQFVTVALDWAPGRLRWFVNGELVREERQSPLPVTPGQFFLSLWSGSSKVDSWLGHFSGQTPVVAYVDWIAFTRRGESCRFTGSITCSKRLDG